MGSGAVGSLMPRGSEPRIRRRVAPFVISRAQTNSSKAAVNLAGGELPPPHGSAARHTYARVVRRSQRKVWTALIVTMTVLTSLHASCVAVG